MYFGYFSSDSALAITHLDKRKARREVMLSILVPLLVMITSGAGIFLLNTKPVQRLVLPSRRSAFSFSYCTNDSDCQL